MGIHDQDDLPHRGIEAFRWVIKVFKPAIHLHGHIHVITPNTITVTQVDHTTVINGYGFREIDLDAMTKRN
jgi:Icc-related predicted phosphoesterase